MPIHTNSHFWNIYSVISPDIVNHIDFYKGGFPARFGGKASSVINVITKEGGDHMEGDVQLGLTHSTLNLNGPINKNTTYVFGIRFAYLDLISTPVQWLQYNKIGHKRKDYRYKTDESNYFHLYFYDSFLKLKHSINAKNKIYFSVYSGYDLYKVTDEYKHVYEEMISYKMKGLSSSLKLVSNIRPNITLKNLLYYSLYTNSIIEESEDFENKTLSYSQSSNTNSNFHEAQFKTELRFKHNNKHSFKSGFQLGLFYIEPLNMEYTENNTTDNFQVNLNRSLEGENKTDLQSFFIEDEYTVFSKLVINTGLRIGNYRAKTKSYLSYEPRISILYRLYNNLSFKTGYSKMTQYTHALIRNNINIQDITWVLSTDNIKPINSEIYSIGATFKTNDQSYKGSIEAYYKKMENLIDYRIVSLEQSNIDNWEELVTKNGKGLSHGIEFSNQVRFKKIEFTMNYTLAYNKRKFPGINNNKWYIADFNKRHELNILSTYKISDTKDISINFYYQSGIPITLSDVNIPEGRFVYKYHTADAINNYRMRPFHRLDINYKTVRFTKKGRKYELLYSMYNTYFKTNPSKVYFKDNKLNEKSLLLVVPSITYKLYFN